MQDGSLGSLMLLPPFQNNLCVPEEECPCAVEGMLYAPGDAVAKGCENWSVNFSRVPRSSSLFPPVPQA